MAAKTITQAQLHALKNNLIVVGEDTESFEQPVRLKDIEDTLVYLGGKYALEIKEAMARKDADSSGKGFDSVVALEVEIMGGVYSVSIEANKYLSFVSEGVDGWAAAVGGKHKFKTRGVLPDSPMVKAVKEWLLREGKISRNMKYKAITKRENKQKSITDASTKAAMKAAFMIKRQGIKPRGFYEDAKTRMERIVEEELKMAIKVDIINNLT